MPQFLHGIHVCREKSFKIIIFNNGDSMLKNVHKNPPPKKKQNKTKKTHHNCTNILVFYKLKLFGSQLCKFPIIAQVSNAAPRPLFFFTLLQNLEYHNK